jgi:hypothetical protein
MECSQKTGTHSGYNIYVPEDQQNIMSLLYACASKNTYAIRALVEDPAIDIYAKSIQGKDALIVLLNSVKSENTFLKLAKPLLQILSKSIKRIDYLGTDDLQNTALHLLIERNWSKTIKWFNHKIFFAVVDKKDYDPLMLAIARGKQETLRALFKLDYVKRHLRTLLLIKENVSNDVEYVLKRALKDTPKRNYNNICKILLRAVKLNSTVRKKILSIINVR